MGKHLIVARTIYLFIAFWFGFSLPVEAIESGQPADRIPSDGQVTESTRPSPVPVHLYFGSPNGSYLVSETRAISSTEDPVRFARSIITALIDGPRGELTRTLPAASQLQAVFVTTENVCIADFSSEIRDQHPGGGSAEMLTVYSIVNSLIINIPSIKRVKLLIDGSDIETFSGHMIMRDPLTANMLIIR